MSEGTGVLPRASDRVTRPRLPAATSSVFKHLVLILVGLVVAYPFYFMITTALKDFAEASATPPTFFPAELHPENYAEVWAKQPWGRFFANTVFVAVTTVFGEIVIA